MKKSHKPNLLIWILGDLIDSLYKHTRSSTKSVYSVGCIVGLNVYLGDDYNHAYMTIDELDSNFQVFKMVKFLTNKDTTR